MHLFRHTAQKFLDILLYARVISGQSDEKFGGAICTQSLCGAALKGFVLSYNKPDGNTPSAIAVLTGGAVENGPEAISGIAIDQTQNYFFYIPAETETAPYTVTLCLSDAERAYEYEIRILQTGSGYAAEK